MQTLPLPSAQGAPNRLFYLDTLRIVLTILVIVHHVGQAYGPTGGYWPVQEAARAAVLGPFFTVNRSFFMSLFFMISGYFMVAAFERHTVSTFIRGRLVRLGIPVLLFTAIMLPLRILLFGDHITRWSDIIDAGHLWYLEHVLLFSIVYALWMTLRKSPRVKTPRNNLDPKRPAPGLPMTIAALLVVAALCGVVRIWSPIDRWNNLLGFFRVAFADVPRDLSFFIFGAMAFKRGWFENFSVRAGMAWLAVGVAAAVVWYAWALIPHPSIAMSAQVFAIVRPTWEAVLCFGMCIGLLVLFRQVTTGQGRFGKLLAANQYSAYFWHPMLIVGIQMLIVSLPLGPFMKFVAVTVVGVPVVFLWSWLLRNLRIVRAVF